MDALLLLKVTLLLGGAHAGAYLLRRSPAAVRHRFWRVVFPALIVLPVLAALLPALRIPLPAVGMFQSARPNAEATEGQNRTRAEPGQARVADTTAPHAGVEAWDSRDVAAEVVRQGSQQSRQESAVWPALARLLVMAWAMGAAAALAMLVLSLFRVRRLASAADTVADPAWRSAADAIATRLGLRRTPRLLAGAVVPTPMAGGLFRPTIFVPASARAWPAELRDAVLAHEIAHLASRDPVHHLVARAALACYWFHPLAWLAAREAAATSEERADEAVLLLGARPSAYARMLMDLADSSVPGASPIVALPIVHTSTLEKRLMAILDDDVRSASRKAVAIPAVALALLTLAVAAAQPSAALLLDASPTIYVALPAADAAAIVPVESALPVPAAREASGIPQDADRDSACWWEPGRGGSFRGNISMSDVGGRTVVHEQVGSRGSDRVIQQTIDGLRICMLATDVGHDDAIGRPSEWLDRARRVVLETRRGSTAHRLEIDREAGGGERTSWRVAGAKRPLDATAQRWRSELLAALDTTWELSVLHGEVSSLRGEISSIFGERSSLHGEISSLRGEVSSMRGEASSIRGEESSLRGEISSIHGHVSSLRGEISSERGSISSLNASRYAVDGSDRQRIATRIAQHEAEIDRIEREIRDYDAAARVAKVEKEIAALDADSKVAAIDARIKAFDLDAKVAAVERKIAELDVDRRVKAIEQKIHRLDVDRRSRQLEDRRGEQIKRLEATIRAIR